VRIFFGIPENGQVLLDEGESLHLARVLRINAGETVYVCDGAGSLYLCRVEQPHHKRSQLLVLEREERPQSSTGLHIAFAPTRYNDRNDWFLEKAAELGLRSITPLRTTNSEKVKFNAERAQKILIAGLKQSGNVWLPQLNPLCDWDTFIQQNKLPLAVAYCGNEPKTGLPAWAENRSEACVCIGPEGDFTGSEVQKAFEKGAELVHLGQHRLRTETAALWVAAWFYGKTIK